MQEMLMDKPPGTRGVLDEVKVREVNDYSTSPTACLHELHSLDSNHLLLTYHVLF